jgi:two-component system sensor histidine kinase/response regulator
MMIDDAAPPRRFDWSRWWPAWLPGGAAARRRPPARESVWHDTLAQQQRRDEAQQAADAALIQELRAALDAAEGASRAKSQFLTQLGHEIRTPMSGVTGMAELLAGTPLDRTQRGYLDVMQRAANSLVSLVDRLLDFSRLEAGPIELTPEPLDIRALLDDAVAASWPKAVERALLLECQLAPDLPRWVRGDPRRLKQIVGHLLDNALEHTSVGQVLLAARIADDDVVIEVSDTGAGIDHALQASVFDPFVQGDSSMARRAGGIGLGLAEVRLLVGAMGGSVTLESEPGRGATFTVRLPLPLLEAAPPPAGVEARRIAVVSDAPASAAAIADRARHLGHEVVATLTWRELAFAPEQLDAAKPHEVVYDEPLTGWPPNAPVLADPARHTVVLLQRRAEATLSAAGVVRLVRPIDDAEFARALDPARRVAAASAPPLPSTAPPAPGTRGRVLLVEDHEISQVVARAFLEHMGFEVDVAADAPSALTSLIDRDYLLILMDCQLPGMDGYELTRRIRAAEAGPRARRTPIVALTAHATPADRQRCLDAGMNDYLTKPVGPQQLGDTVQRWLPAPRG